MQRIIDLVKRDPQRLEALYYVYMLGLPDAYIAAGFVRNMVWDELHAKASTPLNDVDVVYFDPDESSDRIHLEYEALLKRAMPSLNWQVRNQAKMHTRNGDRQYLSSLDAMSFWPEKETAVGIRQTGSDEYQCVAGFGFETLFDGCITYNPKRSKAIFEKRINSKSWLTIWPKLKVISQ